MKFKRLLSVILIGTLVVSAFCFPITSFATEEQPSKISSLLNEKMEKMEADEIVPIYIFLKECNKDEVSDNLKAKYNMDMKTYENPSKFYSEIVPEININGTTVKRVIKDSNITSEMLDIDNKNSSISLDVRKSINFEINKIVNSYLKKYRKEISSVVGGYVSKFVEDNSSILKKIIVQPDSAEFIIAAVSKNDIEKLSRTSIVNRISYFEDEKEEYASWNATSVTKTDYITGLGSSLYNNGSGYDGTGVTIGVIEAGSGRYDSSNYNFSNANLSFVSTTGVSEVVTSHATNVTALICGKHVTIDGKNYGGSATGATIYQTAIRNKSDVLNAIIMLKNLGVNVINYSGGSNNGLAYTDYDQAVDNLIYNNKLSMVVAAGNNGVSNGVFSPGKGYNVITVGNLKSKTNNTALSSPYYIKSSSCIAEESYQANKPDVVAPGTDLYLPSSSTQTVFIGSGTSYAAPIVTGIVAQIMQNNYIAKININAVKSYLMCGADNDLITGTTTSYGKLTDESGAGLVNAIKASEISKSGNETYGIWIPSAVTPTAYTTEAEFKIKKGQRLRIALVFSKAENIPLSSEYGNNIDIRLVQNNEHSSFYVPSISENNNVEIIDQKITSTGTYWLQMSLKNSILQWGSNNELRYWISWRIE